MNAQTDIIERTNKQNGIAENIRNISKKDFEEFQKYFLEGISFLSLNDRDSLVENLEMIREGKISRFQGAYAVFAGEKCFSFFLMRGLS